MPSDLSIPGLPPQSVLTAKCVLLDRPLGGFELSNQIHQLPNGFISIDKDVVEFSGVAQQESLKFMELDIRDEFRMDNIPDEGFFETLRHRIRSVSCMAALKSGKSGGSAYRSIMVVKYTVAS